MWRLARSNHLEDIVYSVACDSAGVDPGLLETMWREFYAAVAHDIRQDRCLWLIYDALECAGVPYAPFKGAVLKQDYPARKLPHTHMPTPRSWSATRASCRASPWRTDCASSTAGAMRTMGSARTSACAAFSDGSF